MSDFWPAQKSWLSPELPTAPICAQSTHSPNTRPDRKREWGVMGGRAGQTTAAKFSPKFYFLKTPGPPLSLHFISYIVSNCGECPKKEHPPMQVYDIFYLIASGFCHSSTQNPPTLVWALTSLYQPWPHWAPRPDVSAVTERGIFMYLGALHLSCVFHLRPRAPSEIYAREQPGKAQQRFLRIHSVRMSYMEGNSPPRDNSALHFWALSAEPSPGPTAEWSPPPRDEGEDASPGNGQSDSTVGPLWRFLWHQKLRVICICNFPELLVLGQEWPYL